MGGNRHHGMRSKEPLCKTWDISQSCLAWRTSGERGNQPCGVHKSIGVLLDTILASSGGICPRHKRLLMVSHADLYQDIVSMNHDLTRMEGNMVYAGRPNCF